MVCNADEGDPGAFMDRSILESDPHSVLEGMVIAGYAVGSNEGYIYVRAEYPLAVQRLRLAIAQMEKQNYLGENILGSGFSFHIHIREGAGAFVCGEETALLASIEGKRGLPRPRPPYPAQEGLWENPRSSITSRPWPMWPASSDWGRKYTRIAVRKRAKERKSSPSPARSGAALIEVPMGISIRGIVFAIGGGLPVTNPSRPSDRRSFRRLYPGKPGETPWITSRWQDRRDYGFGGLLVMDDETCMVDVARFFLNFTTEESCGKCTFAVTAP